jgi:hypothetical protein
MFSNRYSATTRREWLLTAAIPDETVYDSGKQHRRLPVLRTDAYLAERGLAMARGKVTRYGHVIGPKLRDVLQQVNCKSIHDLTEELEVVRTDHARYVAAYSFAIENVELKDTDTQQERATKQEVLRLAGEALRESTHDMLNLGEKYARILSATAGKMHPSTLDSLTRQILGFVVQIFEDGSPEWEAKLDALDKAMNEELELLSYKAARGEIAQGTTITPDQQVLAMDACIPAAPPEEFEE